MNHTHYSTLHLGAVPVAAEYVHCGGPVGALQDVALGARSELKLDDTVKARTVWYSERKRIRGREGSQR
jgi:hypothetical protein